jgi:hypothetical protein
MSTPREHEGQKFDKNQYAVDRGAMLLPPEPPPAGAIVILMPPTASWKARQHADVTELVIQLGDRA